MRVVSLALHDLGRHPVESTCHARHLLVVIVTPANTLHRAKLLLGSGEAEIRYFALNEVGWACDSFGQKQV